MTEDVTHIRKRLTASYPVSDALQLEPAQWAAVSDAPLSALQDLLADATFSDALNAEKTRAEIDGRLLGPKARAIAMKALDLIASQMDGLDPFEAAEMLKQVLRVIDQEDRREAAKVSKIDNMVTVSWVINGGAVSFDLVPPKLEVAPAPQLEILEDVGALNDAADNVYSFVGTPMQVVEERNE